MAGRPRAHDRAQNRDGKPQHHIGVVSQIAPLAAGVNATAFRRALPDVDPGASLARVRDQDANGSSGTKFKRKVLTGPAPS